MIARLFTTVLFVAATALSAEGPRDAVIIGGGVGGGSAAIYLGRAGFHPMVIEKASPGGALAQSDSVENWPGELKIRGSDLMERIRGQAEENGAIYLDAEVTSVDFTKRPFAIVMQTPGQPDESKTVYAQTCIIATGSAPNYLHIPGESQYWGKGVSNCAVCDGSLYRKKKVAVVGGGDAAILEGLYLSKIADEVTVMVRKDEFRAHDVKKKEALLALSNVKVLYQTRIKEIQGDGQGVTGVRVSQTQGPDREIALDGVFLAIGAQPNTKVFKNQLKLDDNGYIVLTKGQQTSIEGVYAIGDAVDPVYKQAISAAGDGAKAALTLIQSDLSGDRAQLVEAKKEPAQPAGPYIVEITSLEQLEDELKTSTMPLVVDFYATWCSPCKRIAPKIESTAALLAGKVKFLKVNVDQLGDLTVNYKIKAMPTVLYFDQEGAILDRKVGEREIGELLSQLSKN
ncbi:MAG: Thioredoxin [Parachlamydiales bacterium]|nr:Thioredoxin [Parachlamydiales bacterium]